MRSRGTGEQARPDLVGSFGMCASTHWLASSVGQSVLERGGTAVDAAVAAAFVLHVAEPHLNGPGGDLVAIVTPAGAQPRVLCGQGPAPRGATIERFRAEGLDAVPGAGALAAAVPGAVDAWLLLLAEHGTWSLADVLDYAIDYAIGYAQHGVPLLGRAAATLAAVRELFLESWPTSAALWLPDGRVPEAGEIVANPTYAATLRRLRDEAVAGAEPGDRVAVIQAARRVWGSGFVAEAVDAFVTVGPHRHSSGTDHQGVLRRSDMAAFSASFEEPVSLRFRGHVVHKAGPWSQGPVLLQVLALLDGADPDVDTAAGVHLVVEATKLAMADREAFYGDGLSSADLAVLLSPEYARERRALITDEASHELRPGTALPGRWRPPLNTPDGRRSAGTGEPTVDAGGVTRGDTCHIDVVDRWGNAVSATPSGGWLQSSPAVPGLGFCLGTRLQMTHLDPQSPSALRPGRRPRTTLSPTFVRHASGDPGDLTALGTPGGDQQDQWQLVYLLRTLLGGASPQAAIEAPMFHTTAFPGSFWPRTWEPGGLSVEDRIGEDVINELRGRGHVVTPTGDWSLGRLSAVRRHASGILQAGANPRGAQGYAVGR